VGSTAVLVAVLAAGSEPVHGQATRPSEEEIGSVQVYLTPGEALREIFEGAAGADTVTAVLLPSERQALEKKLGESLPSDTLQVLRPRDAQGVPLGYAVVAEEVGKYRPITFMVGAGPDLKVKNVEVLVYRESRGGEVRLDRFLRQYRGKSGQNAIRINKDILNVAGATMSVNALNHGVKRVLLCLETLAARGAL
jgi:Na+-translocating ferredoxin:NAD+ oxidoreductase RnfG subunit